ncbi:MAG: hypothetical protein MHPSP_002167, partial [Paramarteilia canceri]
KINMALFEDLVTVKGIQCFGSPSESASKGDRVGLNISHSQSNNVLKSAQRGLVYRPGLLKKALYFVGSLNFLKSLKTLKSGSLVSLSALNSAFVAKITIFDTSECEFSKKEEQKCFKFIDEVNFDCPDSQKTNLLALFDIETAPLFLMETIKYISYISDLHQQETASRILFYGDLIHIYEDDFNLPKFYNVHSKSGFLEKFQFENDKCIVMIKNMFKNRVNANFFLGLRVELENMVGYAQIQTPFGNTGKVKAIADESLAKELTKTNEFLNGTKKITVSLKYMKFVGKSKTNKIFQI